MTEHEIRMSKYKDLLNFISHIRMKGSNGKLLPVVLSTAQKKYLKHLTSIEK